MALLMGNVHFIFSGLGYQVRLNGLFIGFLIVFFFNKNFIFKDKKSNYYFFLGKNQRIQKNI